MFDGTARMILIIEYEYANFYDFIIVLDFLIDTAYCFISSFMISSGPSEFT
jgi:hypothetical protein